MIQAVLQGLFEWWPISSCGVLILFSSLFNIPVSESYSLALSLHLASGLAALTLFRRKISKILWNIASLNLDKYTRGYLVAVIISFAVAYPLHSIYVSFAKAYGVVTLLLIAIGLLFTTIFLARRGGGVKDDINIIDWMITGLLQGIAVLPGFSRSGLTMGYLLLKRYRPRVAVEASLLLAIPALIAAGLYYIFRIDLDLFNIIVMELIVYIISIASAKILIDLSNRLKLYLFTLILAILVILGVLVTLLII